MTETTRRGAITAATLGAAAAVAAPAAAQPPQARGGMQDPRGKYPKPPFPPQSQPWPGLAGRMQPRPDHGETSYVGSGRLRGRKALITGGDSGMGRATAIAYAREGADVAINYLPDEEPDAREVVELIRQAGRKAVAIPGDLRSEAFCRRLVQDAMRQLGGLDIIVSNAGRQQSKSSILDITTEDFDATMKTNIYAPFWIIQTALPHLQPGSAIIATTSEQAYDPIAGTVRLRPDQGRNDELRQIARQAARSQGHPRQRRRAWADLDAAADFGWRIGRQDRHLRRHVSARPSGPAGGTGGDLRASGRGRRQLHHRQYLWSRRRAGEPLR
jgi:NAD(P)-dependent dehydrogenase (short-subunit alcohol dehydrogenase family)